MPPSLAFMTPQHPTLPDELVTVLCETVERIYSQTNCALPSPNIRLKAPLASLRRIAESSARSSVGHLQALLCRIDISKIEEISTLLDLLAAIEAFELRVVQLHPPAAPAQDQYPESLWQQWTDLRPPALGGISAQARSADRNPEESLRQPTSRQSEEKL